MGYKTILVHLNDERRAPRLLESAVNLALKQEAHLIGLAVSPLPLVYAYSVTAGDADLIQFQRNLFREMIGRLEGLFKEATATLPRPAQWRAFEASDASVGNCVIEQAHAADLVMASQSDPDWYQSWAFEVPDRLAIESGRPVILVPNNGQHLLNTSRVLVAWNGRSEAARAAFDALPLLKEAREVQVLSLARNDTEEMVSSASDLCPALSRHGVRCTPVLSKAADSEVGAEILRHAKVIGADLVVMGAYGHSRAREFILGGASRHVLRNMTVPMLMSH